MLGPNIVTDGLVLYLDAGNTKSYPGSGDIWYDMSGYDNHANLYNGLTYGKVSNVDCLTADGISDWIGNTTLVGGISDFTLELLFYHNGIDQGGSYGIISMGTNGNFGPMFYCHVDCLSSHYFLGSPDGDYPGGQTSWTNLSWNYHTWVFKDTMINASVGDFKTYVNGSYSSGRPNYNFNNSGMGRGTNGYGLSTYSGGANPYKGSYALFRVYNRTLSATEISQNYNATKTRFKL